MAFKVNKAQMERLKKILNQAEDDHAFMEEMASNMQSEWDDKSEKWQEGENGEAAAELITQLEGIRDAAEALKDAVEEIEGIND